MAVGFVAIVLAARAAAQAGAQGRRCADPLKALRHRGLLITGLVALFYNFGFFTLLAYTPFPLHMGAHALGFVFFGWGLLLAVIVGVRRAAAQAPLRRRADAGGAMYAALAAILVVMGCSRHDPAVLAVCVIVAGAFLGVINTVLTEAVMRSRRVERPVASSSYSFVRFAGGAIAPFLAGKLAEYVSPEMPMLVGAAMVFAAVVVLLVKRGVLRRAGASATRRHGPYGARSPRSSRSPSG